MLFVTELLNVNVDDQNKKKLVVSGYIFEVTDIYSK